jgi:fructose-specific phosphotransferase system IIC component
MPAFGQQIEQGGVLSCRWRVLIAVPPAGFGAQLWVMRAWLDATCGPSGWASAPAGTGGIVNDAVAFYFADPLSARAFVGRFCCAYRAAPRPGL